jgi:hypothetical protein
VRIRDIRVPCWPLLIIPALVFALGYLLNVVAIGVNHGYMPVQGYTECVGNSAEERGDVIHVCMDKHTRLKILSDWIYAPWMGGTASIGDMLEWAAENSMYPCWFIWLGFIIYEHSEDESWD